MGAASPGHSTSKPLALIGPTVGLALRRFLNSRSSPVLASMTRRWLSQAPVALPPPSGENATETTLSSCLTFSSSSPEPVKPAPW